MEAEWGRRDNAGLPRPAGPPWRPHLVISLGFQSWRPGRIDRPRKPTRTKSASSSPFYSRKHALSGVNDTSDYQRYTLFRRDYASD